MNRQDILTLIQFNIWANDRLLAACEQLTDDAFIRAVTPDPGWGSLRGILVHALDTEYGWRSILQEEDGDTILDSADFPTLSTLRTRWEVENRAWLDYVSNLTDEQIQRAGDDGALNVWQTIMHVVMHGIQHRSEAAVIMTEAGHSPGELDFDRFLRECAADDRD